MLKPLQQPIPPKLDPRKKFSDVVARRTPQPMKSEDIPMEMKSRN